MTHDPVRKPIHHRTPTSPARERQPAGHRPSHTGCTHSFRINGGYTDAKVDRLRTAATRRMGAATTARSVRWSGSVGPVRSLRTAMIGPAAGQASAQGTPGTVGCLQAPTANRSSASCRVMLGRVSKQQHEFGRVPQSPRSSPRRPANEDASFAAAAAVAHALAHRPRRAGQQAHHGLVPRPPGGRDPDPRPPLRRSAYGFRRTIQGGLSQGSNYVSNGKVAWAATRPAPHTTLRASQAGCRRSAHDLGRRCQAPLISAPARPGGDPPPSSHQAGG